MQVKIMIFKNTLIQNNYNNNNVSFNASTKIIDSSEISIAQLLKKIQNTTSYDKYLECFEDYIKTRSNAIKINENLIKDNEYYIKSEFLPDSINTKFILELLKENKIDMAPEFVNSVSNNTGFAVTVMKMPGIKNYTPLNYMQNKNIANEEIKRNAYNQLVKLANMDIINIDILKHPEVLQFTPNKIFCEDWSNLCTKKEFLMNYLPDDNYFEILKKLNEIIYK